MHPKLLAFLRRVISFKTDTQGSTYNKYLIRVVAPKTKDVYNLQAHVWHDNCVRSWPFKFLGTVVSNRSRIMITEVGDNCSFYDRSFDYPVDAQALIDGGIASLEADDEAWEQWIHDHNLRRMRREMREAQ